MNGRPPAAGSARDIPRTFRVTQRENLSLEQQAADRGFKEVSAYLRWLVKQDASAALDAHNKRGKGSVWDD